MRRFVVESSECFTSLIPKDAWESGDHSTIFYFPARWVLWQQGLLTTEGTLLSGFTSKLWKSIQSSAHEEKRWGGLWSRAVSASQAWYQKMRENLEITVPCSYFLHVEFYGSKGFWARITQILKKTYNSGLSSREVVPSQAWYQKMRENLEITVQCSIFLHVEFYGSKGFWQPKGHYSQDSLVNSENQYNRRHMKKRDEAVCGREQWVLHKLDTKRCVRIWRSQYNFLFSCTLSFMAARAFDNWRDITLRIH